MVAPETAAHAAGTSALLPMLSLGVPGSPTAAVLLGGLLIWGLQPGPLLFVEQKEFVWGLIASMYLGNIVGLIVVLTCVPLFAAILRIPFSIIAPIILVICAIGAYTVHNSMFDVFMMLVFGVVGYVLKKCNYPLAPMVLALVLGDKAEESFRQSLLARRGACRSSSPTAGQLHHGARPDRAVLAADPERPAQGEGCLTARGAQHPVQDPAVARSCDWNWGFAKRVWPLFCSVTLRRAVLEARERFGREVEVGGELLARDPAEKRLVLALEPGQAAGRVEQVERDRVRHDLAHQLHHLVLEPRLDVGLASRNATHCGIDTSPRAPGSPRRCLWDRRLLAARPRTMSMSAAAKRRIISLPSAFATTRLRFPRG